MTLGNSMLIPVLPAIRRELGLSPFQTSLIITVFSVMAILFIPPAGWLSDRIGRKRVILPCLILAGVALGPPAASLLGRPDAAPLFWCLAAAGAVSALVAWLAIRPGEPNPRVYTGPRLIGRPSPGR